MTPAAYATVRSAVEAAWRTEPHQFGDDMLDECFSRVLLAVVEAQQNPDKPIENLRSFAYGTTTRVIGCLVREEYAASREPSIYDTPKVKAKGAIWREAVAGAMRRAAGSVADAAKLLGISRRTLSRHLRRMEPRKRGGARKGAGRPKKNSKATQATSYARRDLAA